MRWVQRLGLRRRIMVLVALGMLLTILPLGIIGMNLLDLNTRQVLDERLLMARSLAGHVDEELAEALMVLGWVASRVDADWPAVDPARMSRSLRSLSQLLGFFFHGLVVLDATGRVVGEEPPGSVEVGASHIALPSVRQALSTGQPAVSGFVRTPSGTPVVILSFPLGAGDGAVKGLICAVIDLNKDSVFKQFVMNVRLGTTGHAAIVDSEGIVLFSTEARELYTKNEHPDFFATLIKERRTAVGPAAEVEEGREAETHIMAFAPLQRSAWGVALGQTEAETFAHVRRLRNRMLAFGVAVLCLALLFAWLDTGAVTAPILALTRASERIAAGDLATCIRVDRADEIGTLASSFDAMRARLSHLLEEKARLQDQLQAMAVVEERHRIAREMHDGLAQTLGFLHGKVGTIEEMLASGQRDGLGDEVRQLTLATSDAYEEVRRSIFGLRTMVARGIGFLPAVTEYLHDFSEQTGVAVDLAVDGEQSTHFSPEAEVQLVRIIQEALANVRRHAKANRVRVRFEKEASGARVTIEDNGIGFDPARAVGEGVRSFGLQTMRERAESLGGGVEIDAAPGRGTKVIVHLPAGA
ncbi:MAG: HAMP domain-containing protein [Armatimonadetes bacterium]|nr:HAMP domain-containing protein [Armatimonadota bacterium]